MSITRLPSERIEEARDEAQKAVEEFLKRGGKVKQIPEGEVTEAKDMKFKFRRYQKTKNDSE